MFPPFIIFKGRSVMWEWTQHGPDGARYSVSDSGWINSDLSESWLRDVIVPWARQTEKPKVLLGDNHSSHLTPEAIRLCIANNICFAFLPRNATHLCQVSFSRSCAHSSCSNRLEAGEALNRDSPASTFRFEGQILTSFLSFRMLASSPRLNVSGRKLFWNGRRPNRNLQLLFRNTHSVGY